MSERRERVLYVVRTWVPEQMLEEWNRWHSEVHMPDVASQPGIISARKFRVADDSTPADWPAQYITIYEFESWQAWQAYNEGQEAARLRHDYAQRYGEKGKIARQVLVETLSLSGGTAVGRP